MKIYSKKSINKIKSILSSGKVNYWNGNEGKKFEREFSNYIGNKYSVAVSNGSVALEIALKTLGLKKKDQVIVSSRSFVISASCVLNLGLKPVFADVDHNGNLNINTIKKAYNSNVKAIIIVHLNGLACDLQPIVKFVKKNKIFLIEDCSQAHGAVYQNKKVGSFGDISTWSFCTDKIISTGGEGGLISTNKKKLWLKSWSLKDHGKNYMSCFFKKHKTGFKWLHDNLGSNHRMTEIQAHLGREQLKTLDKNINIRNLIANLYLDGLKNYYQKFDVLIKPNFKCQSCPLKKNIENCNKCVHSFYRLNLFVNKKKINQIKLVELLNKKMIDCSIGACPEIYREKIFKKYKFSPKKRLSNAKLLGETSIVFPINPQKSLNKVNLEIMYIKKILSKFI
jgi:dTDP-4-amino-4,6-dideoxygalactose transaminase